MAPKRKREELNWKGKKDQILEFYITQNKSSAETAELMAERNFKATVRMYKTRFKKWKVGKYKTPGNPNGQGRGKKTSSKKSQKTAKTTSTLRYPSLANTPETVEAQVNEYDEYPPNVWQDTPTERDAPGEAVPTLHISPDLRGVGHHLDPSAKRRARTSSEAGALVAVHGRSGSTDGLTPESLLTPISILSPGSGSVGSFSPLLSPAVDANHSTGFPENSLSQRYESHMSRAIDFGAANANSNADWPEGAFDAFNGFRMPRSVSFDIGDSLRTRARDREHVQMQVSRIIGSPSLSDVSKSNNVFRPLKAQEIHEEASEIGMTLAPESSSALSLASQISYREVWFPGDMVLHYCGLACKFFEDSVGALREESMRLALGHYEFLLKTQDDQALSVLSVILGVFCTAKKFNFVIYFLKKARTLAKDLRADEVIVKSITFMISMAASTSEDCEIDIPALAQIANDASRKYGRNHKHTIVTKFNLGWQLAMNRRTRLEALEVLLPLRKIVAKSFEPGHLHSIALHMVLARLYRHLGKDECALQYATSGLNGVQGWPTTEDNPNSYHLAVISRHETFREIRPAILVQ